jgi:uncharacterized protein YlxW (UPF0749 family)
MNIKLQIAFFVLLLLINIIIIFWTYKTETRLKKLFLGKKAKDLEDLIVSLSAEIKDLQIQKNKIQTEVNNLYNKTKKSIRGLETIRFNPFPDQGGNQSFAIGMLDEEGNGLVLSSLYSRERMSVFAKPIKNGKSEHELTEEEKEVLNKAKIK